MTATSTLPACQKCYLLTVEDMADFGAVKHQSLWTTQDAAMNHAESVIIPALIAADKTDEWKDCYNATVQEFILLS